MWYAVNAVFPTAYAAFSVNIEASSPYLKSNKYGFEGRGTEVFVFYLYFTTLILSSARFFAKCLAAFSELSKMIPKPKT